MARAAVIFQSSGDPPLLFAVGLGTVESGCCLAEIPDGRRNLTAVHLAARSRYGKVTTSPFLMEPMACQTAKSTESGTNWAEPSAMPI